MRTLSKFTDLNLTEAILICSALDARAHELKRLAELGETCAEANSEVIAMVYELRDRLETELVTFGFPLLVNEVLS